MAREKCAVCKAGIRENRRNYNLPKDINALVFFFGTTASNHPKEGKLCNLCYMNWRNTVTKQSGPSGVVGELPASSVATGSVELGNVELQDGPSTPKKRPPPDVANTDPSNESFSTIEPNRLRHHTPSGKVAKQTRCSEGLVNETNTNDDSSIFRSLRKEFMDVDPQSVHTPEQHSPFFPCAEGDLSREGSVHEQSDFMTGFDLFDSNTDTGGAANTGDTASTASPGTTQPVLQVPTVGVPKTGNHAAADQQDTVNPELVTSMADINEQIETYEIQLSAL
eukprot:comp21771_c0_seq1/m.30884 comp21771_c0_seq1/g.30884  ORF comp21771_c0_seq1/g.30884 comp21771_c0_seq1/m.30884 type:complete len:280 (-) comp21771_c0_seq1:511-1350(-)